MPPTILFAFVLGVIVASAQQADRINWYLSFEYSAVHQHDGGGCRGRLIVTEHQVLFESAEVQEHTRPWPFLEVRHFHRTAPGELVVVPRQNEPYRFLLDRPGMDTRDYKRMLGRIAVAHRTLR